MAPFFRNLISLGFAVLTGLLVRAQEQKAEGLDLQFTVFAGSTVGSLGYLQPQPKGPPLVRPVTFYPMARSPRYVYRGPTPLEFVDLGSKAVVAIADIPPAMHNPLLIFSGRADAGGGTAQQVLVIDDSTLAHGADGVAILNLSGLILTGTIGRHSIQLLEGWNPPISIRGSTPVQLRTDFRGRSYQSFADRISVKAGERALLILLPPYYKGALDVQARLLIDEIPKPKEKDPPSAK